jgi:radical SAM protein with 4Fe4S-binding SPASM domain
MTIKKYTTDGKVQHYTVTEDDINVRLGKIIGDRFISYRNEWDEVNKFNLITDFPLYIQFDTTQKCNFKCPHCLITDDENLDKLFSKETISNEGFEKIIDEASEHQCPSIALHGTNEPLLDKGLEAKIEYVKKRGFIDIMINTNASALTDKRIKKLLDSGLTRIRFSIDAATEETFNKIRVGGNYKKVIRNIERFVELKEKGGYKLPVTGVSFCKQKSNEYEDIDFIEKWKDIVDHVSIQRYIPATSDQKYKEFYPTNKGYHEEFSEFKCPQPFQRLVFRNQDITPCCAWYSRELSLGNANQTTLHQAWNSDLMKNLRELHRKGEWYKNDVCKMCVELNYPASKNFLIQNKLKVDVDNI